MQVGGITAILAILKFEHQTSTPLLKAAYLWIDFMSAQFVHQLEPSSLLADIILEGAYEVSRQDWNDWI